MKSGDSDRRLRVLSLNCWGLKWISKYRQVRMRALGDSLVSSDYDLVCLQECWVQDDFLYIQSKLRPFLPYSHYYFAGALGSGLAVFSRWPILSTSMFPFVLNGRPAAIWRGDWYAGKGVATALVRHESGTLIEFHAQYGKGEDTYHCHRLAQAWDMAKHLRGGVEKGRFVIGTGDFNSYSNSIVHDLITEHGFVVDSWEAMHPPTPVDTASLSEQAQIEILGVTCDSRLNTFRPIHLEKETDDPNAKRIDYIFTSEAQIEEVKVVATERIPGYNVNYSDHFGVSVALFIPLQDELRQLPKQGSLSQAVFRSIREITTSYVIREQKHSFLRIGHFFLGVLVCLSMFTSVWFVEAKGSIFVMLFISTMCSWCGVLDGCIGFVWGRWEQRSLREFAGEIELAKKVYAEQEEATRIAGSV